MFRKLFLETLMKLTESEIHAFHLKELLFSSMLQNVDSVIARSKNCFSMKKNSSFYYDKRLLFQV